MSENFSEIYKKNLWGVGSGHGSRRENTVEYSAFLEGFLADHKIRSVVDLGCGDWQFSQYVNWGEVEYLGVDVVASVVKANQRTHGPRYQFRRLDFSTMPELPTADLIILKDVLQHWPNEIVSAFLPRLKHACQYALITNTVLPAARLGEDTWMGGFRPLDLRNEPFRFPARPVLTYRTDEVDGDVDDKLVLLYEPETVGNPAT